LSELEGFGGALDLSDADTSGFAALDSGTYESELFDYKIVGTKGGEGSKMPANTPMIKLQFKVIEEEFLNRRLFDQFVIPPADYDKEKAAKMKGALVRFLVAMGLEEDAVKNKKFNLTEALDALTGEPVLVTVGQEIQEVGINKGQTINPVKGYKHISAKSETEAAGQLL